MTYLCTYNTNTSAFHMVTATTVLCNSIKDCRNLEIGRKNYSWNLENSSGYHGILFVCNAGNPDCVYGSVRTNLLSLSLF